jgi:WD40 repeat protein
LDWVVMRALSKDRERRYDTVSGLARDARHFLNHEPVSARPPSLLYQLSKMVRDLKLSDDGRVVYTASHDGKVRAFEEGKSESLWEVEYGERVICLEVSPDGSRVVAGFGDGVVMVLGADDGEVILNKKCHAAPVMQVAFLGGNERFATGALDGRARVWLVAGGEGANT